MLALVFRQCNCALKLFASFGESAKLYEQVSSNAGQQVVARQGRTESVKRGKPSGWAVWRAWRHADCDSAVEADDGRWADLKQGVIEKNDSVPVGLGRGAGSRVTSGDRGLQSVTVGATTQLLRAMEQLAEDAAHWLRLTRVMGRVLAMASEGEL